MSEHGEHDPLADVPLFRELQRVLFSGTGPINWELARQVAIAVAVGERGDAEPADEDRAGLEQTVRAAELAVADLTGLEPPASVSHVEPVRRAGWVEANVRGLKSVFEPSAERLAQAMAEGGRHELAGEPVPGLEGLGGLEQLFSRMAPLLMGAQVGVVLGTFGRRALGQYELPIPREDQTSLLFVIPNIAELEREWDLEPAELRAWVALHETAHAFQLDRAWVTPHLLEQIRELAGSMTFDLSGLEERLTGLDLSDPDRLAEAMGSGGLFGQELTDEQRLLMRRVQALMAVAEGHADHVIEVLGTRMLRSRDRIEEAMRRRAEGRSHEERLIGQLLGLELSADQHQVARAFCERVVEATDEQTLARMWESAEALPSMPELEEPTLWLSRTA